MGSEDEAFHGNRVDRNVMEGLRIQTRPYYERMAIHCLPDAVIYKFVHRPLVNGGNNATFAQPGQNCGPNIPHPSRRDWDRDDVDLVIQHQNLEAPASPSLPAGDFPERDYIHEYRLTPATQLDACVKASQMPSDQITNAYRSLARKTELQTYEFGCNSDVEVGKIQ